MDKNLGRLKINDNGSNKLVFIAEDLESLITLLSLNIKDEVAIEGDSRISYRELMDRYITTISAFYPSFNDWLLKDIVDPSVKTVFDSI